MKYIPWVLLAVLLSLNPLFAGGDNGNNDDFYQQVVKIAQESIGLTHISTVEEQKFTSDCIGFVNYVYYKAGVNLYKTYYGGRGGVESLYYGLERYGFVYEGKSAQPGDIIFFNYTYDINKNGQWDDPLSHVAIVESVGKHNTLNYIHYGGKGVSRGQLNLSYPNTHAFRTKDGSLMVINSYLRRDGGEGYVKRAYLSSFFYKAFAHVKVKRKE